LTIDPRRIVGENSPHISISRSNHQCYLFSISRHDQHLLIALSRQSYTDPAAPMPAQVGHVPTLSKPKSKLRLRLGLGGDPSPKRAPVPFAPISRSATSSASYQPTSSTNSTTVSPNAPTESLGASTNTTWSDLSRFSRGDSRSAFGLEISPSTASHQSPDALALDTISYATSSPRSSAFDSRLDSTSTLLLREDDERQSTVSPPPRLNSLPYIPDRFKDEYVGKEAHLEPEDDESEDERDLIAVNQMQRMLGVNDIFKMTTQQLFESFHFIKEVGFGNWGSVWQCVPRRTRSVHINDIPLNLGKKAAAFGGYGAGGRVAVKLVHRRKVDVSCRSPMSIAHLMPGRIRASVSALGRNEDHQIVTPRTASEHHQL